MAVFEPERFDKEVYVNEVKTDMRVLKTAAEMTDYLKEIGVASSGKKEDLIKRVIDNRPADGNVLIYEEFMEAHPNLIRLSEGQMQDILRIRENVWNSAFFSQFKGQGMCEEKIEGEIDGVKIRGRIDWMLYDEDLKYYIVTDLKKTTVAKMRTFQKAIYDKKYYIQAYLYCELVKQNFNKEAVYAWMVAESKLPHLCEMYSADSATLEAGELMVKQALKRLKECYETDEWPGYSDGRLQNISLPYWAFDAVADETYHKEDFDVSGME